MKQCIFQDLSQTSHLNYANPSVHVNPFSHLLYSYIIFIDLLTLLHFAVSARVNEKINNKIFSTV